MASVLDVAAYILQKRGKMTAMKLQKLVYYAQAWGLVWDEEPLFTAKIEAWANGPVVRSLYAKHRLKFKVGPGDIAGDGDTIPKYQQQTVDAVLRFYGDKTSQWLSDLTHSENPWKLARARAGLAPGQRGTAEITHEDMAEYYGSLFA